MNRYTSTEQLGNWFGYHPPANSDIAAAHDRIRGGFLGLAMALNDLLPEGPDKTTAFRKLREAMFAANDTLACGATPEYRLSGRTT